MKVLEFHPDDLLDRELQGALSARDRARLDEHLQHCEACRVERQLRADLEDELGPGPKSTDLSTAVSGALQRVDEREGLGAPAPGKAPGPAWPRRRSFLLVLAATLLLGTGLALGQGGWAGRVWRRLGASFEPLQKSAPASRKAGEPAPAQVRAPAGPPSAAPALPAAAPQELPGAAIGRAAGTAGRHEAARSDAAEALFERANRARREGRAADAGRLYYDLRRRFPESPEARLSLAVVARMQLDGGQYARAAAGFEAYLATAERPLREEAMIGRVLALERLGRVRASELALAELLRAFPSSSYAGLARTRAARQEPP